MECNDLLMNEHAYCKVYFFIFPAHVEGPASGGDAVVVGGGDGRRGKLVWGRKIGVARLCVRSECAICNECSR